MLFKITPKHTFNIINTLLISQDIENQLTYADPF